MDVPTIVSHLVIVVVIVTVLVVVAAILKIADKIFGSSKNQQASKMYC